MTENVFFFAEYRCFCRKVVDPAYDRRETPHSCGEVCNKPLKPANSDLPCPHRYNNRHKSHVMIENSSLHICCCSCKDLCHPGPCAPCTASVSRSCPCGKTKKMLKCTAELPLCESACGKGETTTFSQISIRVYSTLKKC